MSKKSKNKKDTRDSCCLYDLHFYHRLSCQHRNLILTTLVVPSTLHIQTVKHNTHHISKKNAIHTSTHETRHRRDTPSATPQRLKLPRALRRLSPRTLATRSQTHKLALSSLNAPTQRVGDTEGTLAMGNPTLPTPSRPCI